MLVRSRRVTSLAALCTASSLVVSLFASPAAADDCPPGSVHRSEEGYSFCEPTVCQTDAQCSPDEVCRPIALCMQVGSLDSKTTTLGEAGKRLVVTQRCAPDKTCPQTTVCSDMGRCVSKSEAEKMGILSAPTAAASATQAGAATAGDKKSCGCHAPGSGRFDGSALLASAGVSVAAVVLARRRRYRSER